MQWLFKALFWGEIIRTRSSSYDYLSYDALIQTLDDYATRFPDCVTVFDALERWPEIASFATESLNCGSSRCKFMVAEVGNAAAGTHVFLSGEVHGNERVGPQAVVETVRLLCDGSLGPVPQDRLVVAIPLANPFGYYENSREENGRDPNRDFPFDQDPTSCLQTVTARVIHRLFYHYKKIVSGITFHGGLASISYPWGSYVHEGEVAPDDASMGAISAELQRVGGRGTYEIGPMNEVVYPVHGGMEDWAYVLGFENTVQCTPTSFGGYDSSYTAGVSLPSASLFLIEVSATKAPPVSELGSSSEIWTTDDSIYLPPVPRSVRMALSTIALAVPVTAFVPMYVGAAIPFVVSGCITALITTTVMCLDKTSVTTESTLSCKNGILFSQQQSAISSGCEASVSIRFDQGLIGTEQAGKLTYTRNRVSSVSGSLSEGRCVHVGANRYICVSASKLLIHPDLLHHSPEIAISGPSGIVAELKGPSSVLSDLPKAIDISGELTLTLRSDSGLSFSGALQAAVDTPAQPEPPSKLLLLILLVIPVGILTAYFFKLLRRQKVPTGATRIDQPATPIKSSV